jgi:hypothetical protein
MAFKDYIQFEQKLQYKTKVSGGQPHQYPGYDVTFLEEADRYFKV